MSRRSVSAESSKKGGEKDSPKKKPRVTLARGGACVACRNRKLKCSGEKPCKTCQKANIDCRYEEIQRKKPRAVLLEERVAELENLLLSRGETLPPSQLSSSAPIVALSASPSRDESDARQSSRSSVTSGAISPTGPGPIPLSLHSHQDLQHSSTVNVGMNAARAEITPNSALELALINIVLPHTPHLLMPVHPQRFLALLTLPPSDPQRPHPAFLYILFTEAVWILEQNVPPPTPLRPPLSMFPPPPTPPISPHTMDPNYVLQLVGGTTSALLERARAELDQGIRNVDRPFDLVRAAIGIARHLYSLGRFIEGWNIPVLRLLVSCGLHRMTGNFYPPDASPGPPAPTGIMPKPYAPSHHYGTSYGASSIPGLSVLRMRPVIIPPARDEIDLAERTMVFWAAKMQDWSAGIGWGWALGLADEECTTQWGWGWGSAEPPATSNLRYTIRDLHDPTSPMHTSPFPDTTYVLAAKSLGLLHRASHLFDRPESSYPLPIPDGRLLPSHIPTLPQIQAVETALRLFRSRIPTPFANIPTNTAVNPSPTVSRGSGSIGGGIDNEDVNPNNVNNSTYDPLSDPWWIMLHMNLYAAEMMMYKEMAHHQTNAYETAVSCARAIVRLCQRMRLENWVHVDMVVALDLSLASRFLFKESDRLSKSNQHQAATMAAEEAEILKNALSTDYCRWLPMASLHGLIVQRVREGWAEKEGEFERI
ncbi:hypothetical protein BCR39DRAFT_464647 [Naematelia encephala]|uniref:Zn(2)-C6 fungal-type domain-containing protein n=1 Tax=Naematelia encephala TaxID=71784 RepID=A0A1Y2BE26_9TREE|nr:hypothetical protein BCR39DRAFT_464647 [Naematelia encephala]